MTQERDGENEFYEMCSKLSAAEKKRDALKAKLAVAVDALTSISKNGCCDTCQEAKLVSLKALKAIGGE